MRHFVISCCQETFVTIGTWSLTKKYFVLMIFAVLMIVASFSMIRKTIREQEHTEYSKRFD
ncbi:MAG: hypothetical protein IPQ03_13225 [Bacteroidetes bacterium]|nr:hypothetical protein [Bacteroidota bacterium]